jgi:hypothetical protein
VVIVSTRAGWRWLIAPAAVFPALAIVHARVLRLRKRAEEDASFFTRGLSRIDGRWSGTGPTGEAFLDSHHPYAADLDLFGTGSLFQLLCGAHTGSGREILARWIRETAAARTALERQGAGRELVDRLDFRLDLAMLGQAVETTVRPVALRGWAEAPPKLPSRWTRLAAAILPVVTVGGLATWGAGLTGGWAFALPAALQTTFAYRLRGRVRETTGSAVEMAEELEILARALARFEIENFSSVQLRRLRREIDSEGANPSAIVKRLNRRIDLLDARRNQIFAPVAALLLWETHAAFSIETWRARHGASLASWASAVGELEALCSIAGYAFEHPEDPFPEIVEEGPVFDGRDLGHPLLDRAVCVRNSVRLAADRRLLVVSGSNMSGKSTLLRVVGVNVVLALSGAPVCGKSLRLAPVALGATLRIQDSLLQGASRFFAEITRLRQIVDATRGPRPVLFLLDELLHGTNSHDRQIGAQSILRGLLERNAIGLVTTHDLALAEVAVALGPLADNVHFEDRFEDGRIRFDYALRPGVVRKSNALELMRSIGLDV